MPLGVCGGGIDTKVVSCLFLARRQLRGQKPSQQTISLLFWVLTHQGANLQVRPTSQDLKIGMPPQQAAHLLLGVRPVERVEARPTPRIFCTAHQRMWRSRSLQQVVMVRTLATL